MRKLIRNISIGDRFGLLVVKSTPYHVVRGSQGRKVLHVDVACDCNPSRVYRLIQAKLTQTTKPSRSCGCRAIEATRTRRTTHGVSQTPLYERWYNMVDRCTNPDNKRFSDYGGRGIKVCDEWLYDVQAFVQWSLANGFQEHLQIDRIDVNGDYRPANCRFIPKPEQARNKRTNHYITAFGETKCLAEWGRDHRCLITPHGLRYRIVELGWEPERALLTPLRKQSHSGKMDEEG